MAPFEVRNESKELEYDVSLDVEDSELVVARGTSQRWMNVVRIARQQGATRGQQPRLAGGLNQSKVVQRASPNQLGWDASRRATIQKCKMVACRGVGAAGLAEPCWAQGLCGLGSLMVALWPGSELRTCGTR